MCMGGIWLESKQTYHLTGLFAKYSLRVNYGSFKFMKDHQRASVRAFIVGDSVLLAPWLACSAIAFESDTWQEASICSWGSGIRLHGKRSTHFSGNFFKRNMNVSKTVEGQPEGVGGTNSSDTALEDLRTYGLSIHQLKTGRYRPKQLRSQSL